MKLMKRMNAKGFTLLEVMMGLVIFSLGLLLLSSMLVVAMKGNVWSNKTTQVVQAMRDKVEYFRHQDEDQMVSGYDVVKGLYRSWRFSDDETGLEDVSLKELTVAVTWHDEKDVAHCCSTSTYIQVED